MSEAGARSALIAPDATMIDTTGVSIDDVVTRVLDVVNAARSRRQ